jgi:hypothetical protein
MSNTVQYHLPRSHNSQYLGHIFFASLAILQMLNIEFNLAQSTDSSSLHNESEILNNEHFTPTFKLKARFTNKLKYKHQHGHKLCSVEKQIR